MSRKEDINNILKHLRQMQQGQIVKIQAKQEEDIQLLENIREYYKVH